MFNEISIKVCSPKDNIGFFSLALEDFVIWEE